MHYAGGTALSTFRQEKLLKIAQTYVPFLTSLKTQYLYFIDTTRPLSQSEDARLRALLPDTTSANFTHNIYLSRMTTLTGL
jgi:hypothetical protein